LGLHEWHVMQHLGTHPHINKLLGSWLQESPEDADKVLLLLLLELILSPIFIIIEHARKLLFSP
jgi:hypothetical protein